MRSYLVPVATLACLCCATMPRKSHTELQVSGGLARAVWTEPMPSCSGVPPAQQVSDQTQLALAVVHHGAEGMDVGVTVEGARDSVVRTANNPTPPPEGTDKLWAAGGFYVGGSFKYWNIGMGASGWYLGGLPYWSLSAGAMNRIWARGQFGRWRPLSDPRFASLGLGLSPIDGVELEVWGGAAERLLWIQPVADRVRAAGHLGDSFPAAGLDVHARLDDLFSVFVQAVGSTNPSFFVGIGITIPRPFGGVTAAEDLPATATPQ